MINIAIIGAGQLGSRHLQALASVKKIIHIQVVDPVEESLKTANARFNEVSGSFKGKISFHSSISELEKELEVVIIATSSKIRRAVIEQVVAHSTVNFLILEKFLFINKADYISIGQLLNEKRITAWVNCPRRMMTFYKELQKELKGPIDFTATGNAWGLGCNGIHLLDLFAFLSNNKEIHLSNDLINDKVLDSKRKGYIEFTGTIKGSAEGSSFVITSHEGEIASPLQINITTSTAKYNIQEGATAKVQISKEKNHWVLEEKSFVMPFQSQLTNIVVDDILETGNCTLTSYNESAHLHVLFLDNLLEHLRKVNNNNNINECPIT